MTDKSAEAPAPDLVERLRAGYPCKEAAADGCCKVMDARSGCLCAEAADTITRLTARVEELEAMLRTASDMNEVYEGRLQELEGALRDIARQELAGEIPVDEIGDELDWLAGYEGCVHRARAALKEEKTDD